MRTAVITVVHGRHAHLLRQQAGLAAGTSRPELRVVVALDDPDVDRVLGDPAPEIVHHPTSPTGLPLAAARNAGAERALRLGAELLVFLDVDCIPGRQLVHRYRDAAAAAPGRLLCGPVAYLPPPSPGGYPVELDELDGLAAPHSARPAPADGEVLDDTDHDLFWSLSFAVTAPLWRTIGGFCEEYTGYGGEDTDFGRLARAAGVGLRWVGGAVAHHQFHPVSNPPVEHVDDILRNAAIFHRRWGRWPMRGWLTAFAEAGLVDHDAARDEWARHPSPVSRTHLR